MKHLIFCRHLFKAVYRYYALYSSLLHFYILQYCIPLWNGVILPGSKLPDKKLWGLMTPVSSFPFQSWNSERIPQPWSILHLSTKMASSLWPVPTLCSYPYLSHNLSKYCVAVCGLDDSLQQIWSSLREAQLCFFPQTIRDIFIDSDRECNKVLSWTWKRKENSS